jgi:hypothetical protein
MISNKVLTILMLILCFNVLRANEDLNTNSTEEELAQIDQMDQMNEAFDDLKMGGHDSDLDAQFKQAMIDLGIEKSETIDRENFKKLFAKVILDDEVPEGEEKEMFDKLIERVVSNAPETFPTKDLSKYVDMSSITNILNELMQEAGINPDEVLNQMGGEDQSAEEEGEAKPDL